MKFPHRRQFLHLAAGAAALPAASRVARAQAYPTRPISMVVPFPAGGPTDVIGRVLTERIRTHSANRSLLKTWQVPQAISVSGALRAHPLMATQSLSAS